MNSWKMTISFVLAAGVSLLWLGIIALPAKERSADVFVPRQLAIIGCEVEEYVWTYDPMVAGSEFRTPVSKVPSGYLVLPAPHHDAKDLEWKIVEGKLDCMRDLVTLDDAAELAGVPSIGADFSRAIGCQMAAMSFSPDWAKAHPGWWPLAVGCPNPIYTNNGTPDDTSDDRIVGYKMPECPSEINNIVVECTFDEGGI